MNQEREQMLGRALTDRYAYEILTHLCDGIGPRMAGTPQEKEARDYLISQFEALGYEPIVEEFTYPLWESSGGGAAVTAPFQRELAAAVLGWSGNGLAEAEVVYVGYGRESDFDQVDVAGKVALLLNGDPPGEPELHRTEKYLRAMQRGAVGFLLMREVPCGILGIGSCGMKGGEISQVPALAITYEDGMLLRRFLEKGPVTVKLWADSRTRQEISWNIRAILPGREKPEERVLIGAHYDCWYNSPCAHDDASGVAVMMGLAKLFKELDPFRRSVEFVAFGVEEIGLFGAYAYAQQHAEDLRKVAAIFNLDGITVDGASQQVFCTGHRELREYIAGLLKENWPEIKATLEVNLYSDHWPLAERGVPGMHTIAWNSFVQTINHTPYDTLDKVSQVSIQRSLAWMSVLASEVASEPVLPFGHKSPEELKQIAAEHGVDRVLKLENRYHFE
ncbi:MAG: M28 family peptidase [Firmicutes bacterium]|nr:M28 family peptidase [Bacillota bacterium]